MNPGSTWRKAMEVSIETERGTASVSKSGQATTKAFRLRVQAPRSIFPAHCESKSPGIPQGLPEGAHGSLQCGAGNSITNPYDGRRKDINISTTGI
jgi:hypothetical protein